MWREVVEAVEVLVVVADRVDLGLHVPQLVDRLHLAGHLGADAGELASDHREAAMGRVLQR